MIVFDLEWNSGMYDNIPLNEIIQIGAVKVTALGGTITGSFCAYIRPVVHKRYSPGVSKLPELELSEDSDLDFRTALEDFAAWCGGDTQFATWGDGDFGVLKQNLAYWEEEFPIPERYYDLQAAFGAKVGASGHLALYHAVEYCQLPDVFDYHNSLSDALYTALVGEWLTPEELARAARVPGEPAGRKKDRAEGLPRMSGRRMGPFETEELLLNNRGCRLGVCPVCGYKLRVSQWYVAREGLYVSKFSCPQHGPHILRLEAARDKKGRLWGAASVLGWTEESRRLLREAREAGRVLCHGRQRRNGVWERRVRRPRREGS